MPDPRDVPVYNLLQRMVCAVVDHPEDVTVTTWLGWDDARFTINVHPEDLGKLIGKRGHTLRAIRWVIRGAGTKLKREYKVVLAEV